MIFGSNEAKPRSARPAAVAGMFYPGEAQALRDCVDGMLAAVPASDTEAPKALIVPHAGYVYSGVTAAAAYARLRPARNVVKRVIVVGPCHRVPLRGLALPEATAFATPLGMVPIDAAAVRAILSLTGVTRSAAAHAQEHALEVQLPFLQRVLHEFTLVPLVVGAAAPAEVAEAIDRLWGGPETLIVVSSDLSHYHRYADAQAIDARTVQTILSLSTALDCEQACGATPIAGLVEVARKRQLAPELVDFRNSGDTAGDKSRVVGYASFAFSPKRSRKAAGDDAARGSTLIGLARGAIGEAFGEANALAPKAAWLDEAWLDEIRATFVTLRQGDALRGCIGTIEARRRLRDDIAANARAAAFSDPRFAPLAAGEWPATRVEVSLLSPVEPVAFADEDALFAQLRPGIDGIVLSAGNRRATFLPQVWEDLPELPAFFAQLKQKAGLAADYPIMRCTVQRYTVRKWSERVPRQAS